MLDKATGTRDLWIPFYDGRWYGYQLLPPAELKKLTEHSQSVERCGRSRKDLEV
jgi:hypothetical protein